MEADLATELENLAALRAQIAQEKPPIAKETNALAAELREKRFRAELAKQERDALLHELKTIESRTRQWRDEANYIDSLLDDFSKQFQSQANANIERLGSMDSLDVLEEAMQEIARLSGGAVSDGRALDSDGTAHDGQLVEAGPVRWFVAQSGEVSGLVTENRDLRVVGFQMQMTFSIFNMRFKKSYACV